MDSLYSLGLIFIAILLVALNGFFVASEFALVKARPSRLEGLGAKGFPSATVAKKLQSDLDATLSATQLGVTLASLGLGWLGEPAFADLLEKLLYFGPRSRLVAHTISFTIAFLLITVLHVVFGELAPKYLAIQKSERVLLWVAHPMRWFYNLAYPIIWFLRPAAAISLRLVGMKPSSPAELAHSEEELRLILAQSQKSGVISREEQQMMESVFDFADRSARQVMVPRSDIVYLSVNKPLEENLKIARENEHTRYPLCEDDIDHVIGIVNIKDLLFRGGADLRTIRRDILFAPEMKSVKELLREFQKTHLHMAVVVDEYGSTAGLVTLEDIMEELIGEIQDEFDLESPKFQRLNEKSYRVAGNLLLEDLEDKLNIEIDDDTSDTIAGYVMTRLGRPAKVGDIVTIDSYRVRVTRTQGFRINELILEKTEAAPADKEILA
ncbi:MAG TPA: hemolysin family protein [Acidobacteriota bacterium]|jgi:CBS domain containing-hemolysin-like protein|nr:hemolysin family protein [Acidobacteriota bacterium]